MHLLLGMWTAQEFAMRVMLMFLTNFGSGFKTLHSLPTRPKSCRRWRWVRHQPIHLRM